MWQSHTQLVHAADLDTAIILSYIKAEINSNIIALVCLKHDKLHFDLSDCLHRLNVIDETIKVLFCYDWLKNVCQSLTN